MGEALIARLKGASDVTAIFGQRIYWDVRPQGSALPALVLQTIGGDRREHLKGPEDMAEAVVQAASMARDKGKARAGAEAVIAALLPTAVVTDDDGADVVFWRGSAREPIDLNEQDETGTIYRPVTDLTIRWGKVS